ncbi:MAG TPA: protein-L-isoaspartate(D-aspartate) O-methyltransferase [Streptosporangiaceae bacterium]|nr:protein-L-isoaspartate(D-aspartate) O-methyltransferase [Streptosporangiaceae bacterium]
MTDAAATGEQLNRALADLLHAQGHLTDTRWREALLATPRHLFAPATGWLTPDHSGGAGHRIDQAANPNNWWTAVYSDGSIVTQRQDGHAAADAPAGTPTSSLSAPLAVVDFLQLLELRAHDRVLEIGTGTGWTSALIAHLVGAQNVTTIEVDDQIAAQAADNLKMAGSAPRLIIGNGSKGYAEGAPYDRIHATCAVAEIPYAWVEQTRPGGIIVTPWQPTIQRGWKLRLTVQGATAYGRLHGHCGYMMLRDQRATVRWNAHNADRADTTTTRLDPRSIDHAGSAFALAATARVPKLGMFRASGDNGSFSLLLCEIGHPNGAWAACDYEPGKDDFDVTQYGDRRLWNELEDAFGWWIGQGSPTEDRFGLLISSQDQRLWLDQPSHLV